MKIKIKICHLTSAHKWNDVRIFIKQCSSLAIAGFDTNLIAVNCESKQVNGVNIIGVNALVTNRYIRMFRASKLVYKKAIEVDADIYHFHDPELLQYALRLKRKGKIVIYDAHEDVPRQILSKYWINKYLRKTISYLFEKYENYIARRLNAIVCATPFIKNRFVHLNKNTVDINNYPLLDELYTESTWALKTNTVTFTGLINDIRGCEQLVDAMNFAKNVKLILAGIVSPVLFLNKLKSSAGWNNVDFRGQVDRMSVANILLSSKAGIVTFLPLPNHFDAQPNKMFEYMSAGIPVIASDFPLWKEIIEKNNCGICVDPTKADKIAEAINILCANDILASQLGANGRNAILNKYNWPNEANKLIELYQSFF